MTQQISGQMDFADSFVSNNPKLNQRLDKIERLVNWKSFEQLLGSIYSSNEGRPSYPLLLLFKSLLIQQWYAISDYALEEMLDDRLSFRRFVGLSLSQKAPDHSTICRFREQILHFKEALFLELDRQLDRLGLVVKKGTLVDATIIEAAVRKPPKNDDGSSGKSELDPEAGWAIKNGCFSYGYKAHLGVDQESELIRRCEMTAANVHDSRMLGAVITGEENWVFADKAYDSQANGDLLRKKKISNGILIHSRKERPTKAAENRCNRILSRLRVPIERVFGTLKRSYRYARGRYIGLGKNSLQMMLTCFAYNLRRMEKLCA